MKPMSNTDQAHLPKSLEDIRPRVATMQFNRTYYTVPWAMWADSERLCWLHPDYDVFTKPGGTVKMRIELRPDGYHVWPPAGESYRLHGDGSGYIGGTSQPFIPITEIHEPS